VNNMKVNLTPELLQLLYHDKQLSLREIGKLLGISYNTVSDYMEKYNIPRRNYSESQKLRRKEVVALDKNELMELRRLVYKKPKELLSEFLSKLEDVPEVRYTPTEHEDISIAIPLQLIGQPGRMDIVLTLVFSDLHVGDSDFLPDTYYNCVSKLLHILEVLKKKFNIVKFILIGNGDLVSGREVYKYQFLRNLLPRGHWQVFTVEIILKELVDKINSIVPVSSIYLCKGTHESVSENYLLYLKKALLSLDIDAHYLSHAKVLNIAEPISKYNVLFTHGYGRSDYYPVSYAMIRDLWKTISQFRTKKIPIERICLGHSHWLTTNLLLEGLLIDVTGGFQRWEHTISQRPSGMLLYLYCNNEVSAIPIRPDSDVEDKEKSETALEYKNMKFYGQMLMKHFKEIEARNEET